MICIFTVYKNKVVAYIDTHVCLLSWKLKYIYIYSLIQWFSLVLQTCHIFKSARKLLKIPTPDPDPKSPSDLAPAYLFNLFSCPHPSSLHLVTGASFCSWSTPALSCLRAFAFAGYLCQELSSILAYVLKPDFFFKEISYRFSSCLSLCQQSTWGPCVTCCPETVLLSSPAVTSVCNYVLTPLVFPTRLSTA